MGNETSPDLWESRALPILRYIAANESHSAAVTVGQIADATGINRDAVAIEIDRLMEAGYIPPRFIKTFTGGNPTSWMLTSCRLTERGARAISVWPRAEQLMETIEAKARVETDPVRKQALETFLSTAKEIGASVLSDLIASAAKAHGA